MCLQFLWQNQVKRNFKRYVNLKKTKIKFLLVAQAVHSLHIHRFFVQICSHIVSNMEKKSNWIICENIFKHTKLYYNIVKKSNSGRRIMTKPSKKKFQAGRIVSYAFVKTAHMPIDCHCFFTSKFHETRNHVNWFLAMTIR